MPELPEVEVVKRSLANKTLNLIIKSVKIIDDKLRYKVNKNQIKKIVGLKLQKILRRSKYLLFFFDKNVVMLVHLGMTGKFFFIEKNKKYKTSFYYEISEDKDKKHNRIEFNFSENKKLIYNDIRKFGFIKLFSKIDLYQNSHLKNLGPEPLSKKFNLIYFKKYLVGRNRTVKDILMDQKFVSGLGNIYAHEVLFFCGIKPTKKIKKLSDVEIKKIIKFTKKILSKAIILGGSSIKNFSSSSGKKGSFQQHFRVYGRKDEICTNLKCNENIKKIVIANRATFYCGNCQK